MSDFKKFILFSLMQFTSCFSLEMKIPQSEVINICVEDAGWPPFTILTTENDKNNGAIAGKNIEFLKLIFSKYNIKYNIHIKPWSRCLYEGINGNIQIVLDAALNEQRRKDYIPTDMIYELTPVYLYNRKKYVDPLGSLSPEELKKLGQGCGQVGYIYNNFGFKNDELNLQSKDLQSLLSLISKNRCAFGLARLEVFKYERDLYNNFNDIDFSNILSAKNESFFWLINKNYKYAAHLKTLIDEEISRKNYVFTNKK